MATEYWLKADLDGTPIVLLRRTEGGRRQQRLDPEGWVSTSDLSWTGIGGDADWEPITRGEAERVAILFGHKPSVLTS